MNARRTSQGLAKLISRVRRRISIGTCGRPPRERDFQRRYSRNPMPSMTVSRCIVVMVLNMDGNSR
jgi:hypothetical protein